MRARDRSDAAVGLVLYALTLAVELPGAYIRATVAMLVWHAIGSPALSADLAGWIVGLLSLAWSVSAFVWPGRGFWWRVQSGGRRPSEREQEWLDDALALLDTPDISRCSAFVVDEPALNAAVRGRTIMLTRGLLHDADALPAVLAHELGHVDSLDGRLTEALNRLVLVPAMRRRDDREPEHERLDLATPVQQLVRALFWPVRIAFRLAVFLATGRLGQFLLGPLWAAHWRHREFAADGYAAVLGHADALADFLELHALFFDLPVPFTWLAERSHPPVELRLQRLRQGPKRESRTRVVLLADARP